MAADWEQIKDAFAEAVELSEEARQAYIAQLKARDRELGEELEALLRHDEQGDEVLRGPISKAMTDMVEQPLLGQSMGAYIIVDTIAAGGMGTVYRARRNDAAFDQDVAIKVMSQFVASETNLTRFRAERQILAQLSHPYIAEMFDGGTTAQGLPYLVMEYIDGVPIDEYCRSRQLNDRQRIELFLKVCEAVSLSHQNLIVHRDIKPSNVLVAKTGVPKLLDFGIAKPLGVTQPNLTAADVRAMTPEYASPEQVRGEAVTTQTDVYALGLLLYRMLTERMPYETTGMTASELEKTICESDPAPLTRTSTDPAPSGVFRVAPDFAQDLNTIVMCTLQKDPGRRYASVTSLVDDINAYLASEPISARPDSSWYRARLFCKRHRIGVSSAALALLATVAFTAYTYQQSVILAIEKTTAERSLEFLTGMFRAASPTVMNSQYDIMPDMKVSELLDLGASRIYSDLSDQPLVQARLLSELGGVYGDRGDISRAIELINEANKILLEQGEAPEILAESRASAAWLLMKQTRYQAADSMMTSAYDLLVRSGLQNSDIMINVATNAAVIKTDIADYQRAHELYEQATQLYHDRGSREPTQLAAIFHNQSWTYWLQGRYQESEAVYLQALDILEEHLPVDHPNLAASYDSGAGLKIELHGDVQAAEQLYLRAQAIDAAAFGKSHPEYVRDLLNYTLLLDLTGRHQQAEKINSDALQTIQQFAEADYEYRGTAHLQMAENARLLGKFATALEHLARYREISELRQGGVLAREDYRTRAAILADQGDIAPALELMHQHIPDTSVALVEHQLLTGRIALLGGNVNAVKTTLAFLQRQPQLTYFPALERDVLSAYIRYTSGQTDQGFAELRKVLRTLHAQLPAGAPIIIENSLLLADWLRAEQPQDAIELYQTALAELIKSGRQQHPLVGQINTRLQALRR